MRWSPVATARVSSALGGMPGSAFPLSFGKTQALLDQLLEVEVSRGAIATIRA